MAEQSEEPVRVRLFVGGLAPGVTAHDLRETLQRLGTIRHVEMLPSKQALQQQQQVGSHRGFAYVDYEGAPASLAKLMSVYNGCKWRGGKLRIEKAKEHYLAKLRREWEADAKSEGGDVTAIENAAGSVSEAVPVSNSVSGRRDWRIAAPAPGLRILLPNTMKVTIVPLKGSGKHKYSFRREESLPLHLIYSSMDDDQGVASANAMAEAMQAKRSEAKAGRKDLSGVGASGHQAILDREMSRQQPRKIQDVACSEQQSLSGRELEDSLRQERQRQLELLAKLFPDEDDIGNESRDEEMVDEAGGRVVEDVDDLQVNNTVTKSSKAPVTATASSIPSLWDKLFEAAAGVGIASDISDSETSDHIASDGPEDEGPATDSEPQKPPVKGPATTKKRVNWKDLQEEGKKRRRDEGPRVLQKPDDTHLDEGEQEVDTGELATANPRRHLMQDITKEKEEGAVVERNPVVSLDLAGASRDVSDVPSGNLQGRGSVKKREKEVAHANQSPGLLGVAQATRDEANPEEAIIEKASDFSGETREGKWNRLFEAAEGGLQVAGLDQTAVPPEHDGTVVVGEACEQTQMESAGEPPGIQGETQEQKWKRIFEAAGGMEAPGMAPISGGDPAARTTSRRTSKGKSSSKTEDNGKIEAEALSNDSADSRGPVLHLLLPQIDSVNLDSLAGKASRGAGPEVNAGMLSDGVDSVRKGETVDTADKKSHDLSPPTAVTPRVDETVKWMQKASWKSLVGEKGVVGFSLSSTFVPNLLQRQEPRATIEQVPVPADKAEQQPVKPARVRIANADDKTVPRKTDAEASDKGGGAREATAEVTGELCTFMRSETAYQDWLASKSKLKGDFKAKHKAAKRQIRRLRPPRKILLS